MGTCFTDLCPFLFYFIFFIKYTTYITYTTIYYSTNNTSIYTTYNICKKYLNYLQG